MIIQKVSCLALLIITTVLTSSVYGQMIDCSSFSWELPHDTVNLDGEPAMTLTLSTMVNTMNTGYSSYLVLSETGDTVMDRSTFFSGWFPTIPDFPVRTYIFDLKPPFESIKNIGPLQLITKNPDCTFYLDRTTAIDRIDWNDESLQIFPNPALLDFAILAGSKKRIQSIQLLDPTGVVLRTYQSADTYFSLDGIVSGFYVVRIHTEDGYYSTPIIVQ